MKKIIYIVCGIFIFGLVIENTNFMYAEDEETLLIEDNAIKGNEIEDNKLIFGEDTDNFINEYQNEELIESEKSNSINEIMVENDMNGLANIEEIQTFEAPQTTQTIDTSNYGIIRIKDPNNTGKGITMHDRNLGATATGAGVDESRESFGYYFQWGNNYGFPSDPNVTILTTGTKIDASGYGPNTDNGYYSSDIFIKGNYDWSSVHNNNLRGGSGDSRNGNGRGYPVSNPEDRRGPCPENYHVPSIGEWSKLLEFWADSYTGTLILSSDSSTNLNYFENNITALNYFYDNFYIPIAGNLSYKNSHPEDVNIQSLLRSSSPATVSNGIFRFFGTNPKLYMHGYTDNRANAFSIRCFYNSYRLPVIIKYDINGGYRIDDEYTQEKIVTYTKDNDDSEYSGNIVLGNIKKNNICGENGDKKCMFGGWYTLTGDNLRTGNTTEDITLYAKWLEFDDKDITYSGVNFSIMDRNLGSEISGTGEDAHGYYITGEDDILCPEGYHIPSTGEWLGIKKLLGSDLNGDLVNYLFNLPFAGKSVNDEIMEAGVNAYYLAEDGDEVRYAKISNSDIEIGDLDEGEKVSVRCFKDYNTGTIKFYSNGGNDINDIFAVNRREEGEDLQVSERDNSIFSGWYTTSDFQEGTKIVKNINYKNEEEINLYAKWECAEGYQENGNICERISKPSGGSSGGGGGKKDAVISNDIEKSVEYQTGDSSVVFNPSVSTGQLPVKEEHNNEKQMISPFQKEISEEQMGLLKDFPQEFIDAYNFAYKNGITTKKSIYDAKMYSPLTRIQMAKMLSNYAINVLGKKPDFSKGTIKFSDVSDKLNKEYDNAITIAYQLGIMGQNIRNNIFRPYDEVTRSEFATALSRLLYGIEDGKDKYYEPHMIKLYNEGIINKADPNTKDKRGYVMIMLMRSIEKIFQ